MRQDKRKEEEEPREVVEVEGEEAEEEGNDEARRVKCVGGRKEEEQRRRRECVTRLYYGSVPCLKGRRDDGRTKKKREKKLPFIYGCVLDTLMIIE